MEKDFSFDPLVFNLNESCYLYGNWASYHYFEDYEKELRKVLNLTLLKAYLF